MQNEDDFKPIVIYSIGMVNYLCNNGFRLCKVEDSYKDPTKKVFLFADTTKLRIAMSTYPGSKRG